MIGNESSAEDRHEGRAGKTVSKVEALYVGLMCFAATCLSSVSLEVGTGSPLGHAVTSRSAAFDALFRRSYGLKIKILATSVISGFISTIMVACGDKYGNPYLYIPWLINTLRGMALREGPALLDMIYALLPDAGVPSGTFVFIALLLYVEELCLWNDVFSSFQRCWAQYNDRKFRTKEKKERRGYSRKNVDFAPEEADLEEESEDIPKSMNSSPAQMVSSGSSIVNQRAKNILAEGKARTGRSRFTQVTG
ncbi:uncharacterized protein LOC105695126 [Orussus abietinus]|uniref:uncharacterized protein LOC105695126 n=1 Tax=Orussus abietinus TaxID=222816 RepID=UPI000626778A|nr:uncharacterized protein LOC105695126 [Orussus abietinus]